MGEQRWLSILPVERWFENGNTKVGLRGYQRIYPHAFDADPLLIAARDNPHMAIIESRFVCDGKELAMMTPVSVNLLEDENVDIAQLLANQAFEFVREQRKAAPDCEIKVEVLNA